MIRDNGSDCGGAKAPFSDHSCKETDFLYKSGEPTPEMIRWYFSTPSTKTIDICNMDDRTMIISICETFNGRELIKSFTIGNTIKREIYRNYMFHHH